MKGAPLNFHQTAPATRNPAFPARQLTAS